MRAASIISAGLAVLIASVSARPTERSAAVTTDDYQITNLKVHAVTEGNTTIRFDFLDPATSENKTTVCAGSWKTNTTDYPSGGYSICSNISVAWNFVNYNNIHSFELGLEHNYEDASVGPPPYDYVDNFGQTTVNKTQLRCTGMATQQSCEQHKHTTIYAPIYASIAKK